MSLFEVSIIISLIATVGHFLFMWGAYVEKKLALVSLDCTSTCSLQSVGDIEQHHSAFLA